jgi:hypothetical protein
MSVIEFAWGPARTYRCFVNRAARTATLLSARIVDDATGRRFGPVMIVADRHGTVCDVEFQLTAG